MYTVADLKRSISRTCTGINLDNLEDVEGTLQKAARTVILNAGVPEATAKEIITIYDGVYDYAINQSIFNTAVLDFYPTGNTRDPGEKPQKVSGQEFDRLKKVSSKDWISFGYDNGVPIAKILSPRPKSKVQLDTMQDATDWVASGAASLLTEDEGDYFEGSKSLRFYLDGVGLGPTGVLTKAIDSVDLTDYKSLGVVFLAVEIPDASLMTSIKLRIGSSASAYNEVTSTAGFTGAWISDKWLLVPFDMSTASTTGSPDWSAIDYIQIRIVHTTAMTNFRVGDLFISRPSPHEMLYATTAIWKASGANPSRTITGDNDEILLSDGAYLLLEDEGALEMATENGGSKSSVLIDRLQTKLYGRGNDIGSYARYKAANPSQRLEDVNSYSDSASRMARRFRR